MGDPDRPRSLDAWVPCASLCVNASLGAFGRAVAALRNSCPGAQEPSPQCHADNQTYPTEYKIGKRWVTRHKVVAGGVVREEVEITFAVVAREFIDVAAGRFEAFRVEGAGWAMKSRGRRKFTYWVAPDRVRKPVLRELWRWDAFGPARSERIELVAFAETRS